MRRKYASIEERFWSWVKKGKGRACWEWLGGRSDGYGKFWASEARPRERAPRYAFELENGPIPKGLWVLHRCDNPGCVNPKHLELGTPKDNQRQKWERGRARGISRLNDADVAEILRLAAEGIEIWALGRKYKVPQSTIEAIVTGRRWKRVPGPRQPALAKRPRRTLRPGEEPEVAERLALGVPKAQLAREYDVDKTLLAELEAQGLPEKPPAPEKGTQEEVDELQRRSALGVMAQTLARDFRSSPGRIQRRLKHGLAEQSGEPKLTAEKVEVMRELRVLGARVDDLAGKYEVSRSTVQQAVDGVTWRSAPGPLANGTLGARARART